MIRAVANDRQTLGRVLVVLLAIAAAVPSVAGSRTRMHRGPWHAGAHIAVVGGQPAEPGAFPWMAQILDARGNDAGQCSGTVVAPDLVLTAAHCAEDMHTGVLNEAAGYQVVTSNVDWDSPNRQVSGVTRVIVCPCFDRRTDVGDVALLQLSTPTSAPALTLASRPHGGTKALLAGWGLTSYNEEAPGERLQWAPTIVQPSERCEREAPPFSPASQICVMDLPSRQTGACKGDSGGPLLLPASSAVGGMVQIGVTDHGYGECATTSPSVFTSVDAISAWVRDWAQALASVPPVSAFPPGGTVPAPTLPGIASSRSLVLANNGISLVLSCDGEGGTCTGDVQAVIGVRERLVVRRDAIRRVLYDRARTVRLTSVSFAIAPGYSTAVRAPISPQNRELLSRLGRVPLDVTLVGRGFSSRVVALEPTRWSA